MRDNELIAILGNTIEDATQSAGWNIEAIQSQGPTQQGIPDRAFVFYEKLFDDKLGWPQDKYMHDPATGTFVQKSVQSAVIHFQISVIAPQNPADTSLPTASDVANYVHDYITSRFNVEKFNSKGVGIFRVSEIRNGYFIDDKNRNSARPNFDLALSYERYVNFKVPAVNTVEGSESMVL